ncbi:MAG TPA: hypothetical protein VLX92_33300 [Kofleriaceae bacterium]|nr:hypothetical protein [Kofleriaceae bacterium]
MSAHELETLDGEQLLRVSGGMGADAHWIMMHESGGNPRAGFLHAQGRGDGTPGNHSSAFGAFQMIESQRKHFMGADYQSTDINKQYAAATKYVDGRYGGWSGAKQFWVAHHWY